MPTPRFLDRMRRREASLCARWNLCHRPAIGAFFAAISRLGDGWIWAALIVMLAAFGGTPGIETAFRMAGTGLFVTIVYVLVKRAIGRPRPCHSLPEIATRVEPLDQWSFPSGHTMHAACFTVLAVAHAPALAIVLVPFTLLVMVSRVVLGLHWPSDVVAGFAGGCSAAVLALTLP